MDIADCVLLPRNATECFQVPFALVCHAKFILVVFAGFPIARFVVLRFCHLYHLPDSRISFVFVWKKIIAKRFIW